MVREWLKIRKVVKTVKLILKECQSTDAPEKIHGDTEDKLEKVNSKEKKMLTKRQQTTHTIFSAYCFSEAYKHVERNLRIRSAPRTFPSYM